MMNPAIFEYHPPSIWKYPILISVPHSGQFIPTSIRNRMNEAYINPPLDCDFFVDELYQFAHELGVGIIKANYSRYVVDLNRDLKPLYNDGRLITTITPETTFANQNLYQTALSQEEIQARIHTYYHPYHQKIKTTLHTIKQKFGVACLLDSHSIKRCVPSLYALPFPDLILGTNDSQTCPTYIEEVAIQSLSAGPYTVAVNTPFKGGAITRNFANPSEKVYTLQLEMSQDIYMNEADHSRNQVLATQVSAHLKSYVSQIGKALLHESD